MQKSGTGISLFAIKNHKLQGDKASLEAKSDKKGVPGKKPAVVKEEECWCQKALVGKNAGAAKKPPAEKKLEEFKSTEAACCIN